MGLKTSIQKLSDLEQAGDARQLHIEVLTRTYCRCTHRAYDHGMYGCDLCPCEILDEIPFDHVQKALRMAKSQGVI